MSEIQSITKQTPMKLDLIITELENIKTTLAKINQGNGAMHRFREIKAEIKRRGWSAICEAYHPDMNIDDPAAHQLFALYRFVYTNMDRF